MIKRFLQDTIMRELQANPLVCIQGPRYVGKTTLAKTLTPQAAYVSCRELQARRDATRDPEKFLTNLLANFQGAIIDDIEYAPLLMEKLRNFVLPPGKHIIATTSLLSLEGKSIADHFGERVKLYTLWPLSIAEREQAQLLPASAEAAIMRGGFALGQRESDSASWHAHYVRTYCEQDVRAAKSLHNETIFYRFLQLCAQAMGQPVNYSALRRACDITIHTAKAWIELLEQTQFIFLLPPHAHAHGKRIIKSPKLYFVEPALACAVLQINSAEQLKQHQLRERILESFIISDFYKQAFAGGRSANLSFWKDKAGHEVECLIDSATASKPVEITAESQYASELFKKIAYWYKVSKPTLRNGVVIYTGDHDQELAGGSLISWRAAKSLNQQS